MLECDVVPVGPFRMPGAGRDGVLRRDGSVLERLMHLGDEPVTVRAWVAGGGVRVCAEAATRELAKEGVERMRFALGTDHDLRPFQQAFKRDPLLGPVIRRMPWLRPRRRPEPFEALAWAVCEQLIDGGRAVEIERRLVARHGRRSACGSLRDVPSAGVVGGLSPAQVEACGLSPRRSVTLVRAAREVASGRADLARHEPSWRRLRAIPGIGPWTLESLAFYGQGRDDQLPAGDLAYIKLIGRLARLGRRATEGEVRAFFEPYAPFTALAGTYLVHAAVLGR
ncbi:MAG: DNA-3-methyladenine glycosylase 2 family protein [Thermoleophilaceae bacterium]|nr:DNA-3-methyladenine glycosylase 2 family protein [Thermoleophilaceae bacterium]